MNSKDILHLITTIERGGAEKQLLVLVREQIALGYKVEVIFLKGRPELALEFKSLGAKVNTFLENKSFVRQIFLLRKYLTSDNFLVHAHLPKSEVLAALVCKKLSFVVSRHNTEPFWPSAPWFISTCISRFVTYRSAGIIAISKAVNKYLIDNREVASHHELEVVRYGLDINLDFRKVHHRKFLLPVEKGEIRLRIGAIGRLVPQKDYPTMLLAFKESIRIEQRQILYIIGEGELKDDLKRLCLELRIEDKVYFLGKTDNIQGFLESIDLFVLSSKYEGFGLVLLEAMTLGKPILAANNSSIPEVLGEQFSGLFTTSDWMDLSKKMIALLEEENRIALIAEIVPRIGQFSPAEMALRIDSFYKKVHLI